MTRGLQPAIRTVRPRVSTYVDMADALDYSLPRRARGRREGGGEVPTAEGKATLAAMADMVAAVPGDFTEASVQAASRRGWRNGARRSRPWPSAGARGAHRAHRDAGALRGDGGARA